jgi:hypothetical protein
MRRLLCTVFVALLSWPVSGHSEHKAAALPSASKASIAEYFATTKPITVSGIVHSLAWQTKSPYAFIAIVVAARNALSPAPSDLQARLAIVVMSVRSAIFAAGSDSGTPRKQHHSALSPSVETLTREDVGT